MGVLEEMIPREHWGAKFKPDRALAITQKTELIGHHTVIEVPNLNGIPNHALCDDVIRTIERDHHNQWRFSIGYNLVACWHEVLYEGCGILRRGQHCPNHNTSGFGLAYLGDGRKNLPQPSLNRLFHRVWDELSARRGRRLYLSGHRDHRPTNCPGDQLYRELRLEFPYWVAPEPEPTPEPNHDPYNLEAVMQNPVLMAGSIGHHVKILQGLLTAHAGDIVAYNLRGWENTYRFVDGHFGSLTERVLVDWQTKTQSLVPDGVCGPKTWAWLCGLPVG